MSKVIDITSYKRGEPVMNIIELAHWFLSKESMTNLKLQKLCYYAQAYYLAIFDAPLTNTTFEAWVHGPVSPALYHQYKQWGWYDISKYDGPLPKLNKETEEFLETVYRTYGVFSGEQLEQFTHREEPWIKARNGISSIQYCTTEIKNEDMKRYFKNLMENDN